MNLPLAVLRSPLRAGPIEEVAAAYARDLRPGDRLDPAVTTGPMVRRRAVEAALELIEDAHASGARLLTGDGRPAHLNKGHLLELTDVPEAARIMREEPFAPVAPIAAWDDFDDVNARANGTEFGLAACVFTQDAGRAAKTAETLEDAMRATETAVPRAHESRRFPGTQRSFTALRAPRLTRPASERSISRPVSISVRRMAASVSASLRRESPLIARRCIYHCQRLHSAIGRRSSIEMEHIAADA